MRLIKLVLISAIILFGIITAIASLLPSHVRISRAVDIARPARLVWPRLTDIGRWEDWNDFIQLYTNKRRNGDSIIAAEMSIALPGRSDTLITAHWQQPAGYDFGSGYRVISYAHDSLRCTVQWYFDFHVKWYPWEKFQSIVYDQQMGPVMEHSLQNLKRQSEQTQ
ncbi:MAG: SRPBCC family protein [Bacteroidetes bacterium]|nr:SRPBCC family protein [Bacteroidota bacterium]